MPVIKHYEVEQTRSVTVSAVSPDDAMLIASREFAKEQKTPELIPEGELQGHVIGQIEITSVDIRKRF